MCRRDVPGSSMMAGLSSEVSAHGTPGWGRSTGASSVSTFGASGLMGLGLLARLRCYLSEGAAKWIDPTRTGDPAFPVSQIFVLTFAGAGLNSKVAAGRFTS